jgi:two-component system sensor histidine kinase DesK
MQTQQGQETRERTQAATQAGGTEATNEVIVSSGVTFHLWRLYQHAWLVCLFFPLVSLVSQPLTPLHLAMGLFSVLFFAASYTWLMWPHPASQGARLRTRSRTALLLFVVLSLQVTALSLVYGLSFLWLFIGVSAIAGVLLPMRIAFAGIVLFTLLPLFITIELKGGIAGVDWWWLIALMLLVRGLGLDMIGVARMGSAIRELHTARRELARLAVIEERERLSRDLHDLLGQTLSTITLKSELARHLITEDPERCTRELSEMERVARQTLREVREAVAGYRQPSLESELEGARQLLEAAGIDAQFDSLEEALPPAVNAVLAWTVREGVTNVIRHSRAQQCRIHLIHKNGMVCIEVLSDGDRREQAENTVGSGLGLNGLRERVSVLGGHMEAGPLMHSGKQYFRVSVELPIRDDMGAMNLRGERV